MSKINVQFHATPTEFIEFLIESAKLHNLYFVTVQLFPFKAELYLSNEISDRLLVFDTVYFIFLYRTKPNMAIVEYNEFLKINNDFLGCTIGQLKENELKESSMGAITHTDESLKLWKKIIRKFNATTIKGAWVINPHSGARGYYKHHRYTQKAKLLFEKGIKITPFAGCNYYVLNNDDE